MNRNTVSKEIQKIKADNILLELPTSFGKTKQAIDLMTKINPASILIIVPRLVLIDNWKDEINKWSKRKYMWDELVCFSTYVGLKKYEGRHFELVIADECHHLTNRALEYLGTMKIDKCIMLSATVNKSHLATLKYNFKDLYHYKVTAKEAIDSNILPDPRVFLIPYKLDNLNRKYQLELRRSIKGEKITCLYPDRWKYVKDKRYSTVVAICTQQEYTTEISQKIDYWKRMYMRSKNEAIKNKWLFFAGQRLRMLSTFKSHIITHLLVLLKDYRCLTFCNSIEQTEILGKNCINSKNKESSEILDRFNRKRVNHITSCNMLNEGMNLVDCQVGIYASLNSSEIMIKQKLGRLLRHENPVLIIPYFQGTREEEIVEKMLEDYNPELVTKVTSLNQIKI